MRSKLKRSILAALTAALLLAPLPCSQARMEGAAMADASVPAETPVPSETPAPSETPVPVETPGPTDSPAPAETPAPGDSTAPDAQETPAPGMDATPTPDPSAGDETPLPTEPTAEPTPEISVEPTLEPSPTPDQPELELFARSDRPADLRLDPGALRLPEGGMPIPLLYQYEYKTPVCLYADETKTVSSSGCSAAVASMLIAYDRQNYDQTPYTLFYDAVAGGWYHGNGLHYDAIQAMLSRYGIRSERQETSRGNIRSALKAQHPIVLKMGKGTFTNNGHYILLRGLDADGRVLVNDPNNEWNSRDSFSLKKIVQEAKKEQMLVVYTQAKAAPEATQVPEPEPTKEIAPTTAPEPARWIPAPPTDGEMRAAVDATRAPEMPVAMDTPR